MAACGPPLDGLWRHPLQEGALSLKFNLVFQSGNHGGPHYFSSPPIPLMASRFMIDDVIIGGVPHFSTPPIPLMNLRFSNFRNFIDSSRVIYKDQVSENTDHVSLINDHQSLINDHRSMIHNQSSVMIDQ